MNTLLRNYEKYFTFRENMQEYFTHRHHEGATPITQSTVSIVMTACNRSKQTLYTLQTIANSSYKDVQVIIVDDSDIDPILFETLTQFTMSIEFIEIKRPLKWWVNPCVNYNIGFAFIKGGYVIIQNAEVCHVGDPISHLVNTIQDKTYYVFDVHSTKGYAENEILYTYPQLTTDIYTTIEDSFQLWFHRTNEKESFFHFLTGMKKGTFDLFNGFSYDYSFGTYFDDNDLLLRIRAMSIEIKSICHVEHKCGGIHLYHALADDTHTKGRESNYLILHRKEILLKKHGFYFNILSKKEEYAKRVQFFLQR